MELTEIIAPVLQFLQCKTPEAWLQMAARPENLPVLLKDHLVCELKAAQTAMLMIRKYAAAPESADTLLTWLKPYENMIYRHQGSLAELLQLAKLKKSIIPRSDSPFGAELIDRMVLLIREELHHFCQVYEVMDQRGIVFDGIVASRYAKTLIGYARTYEPHTFVDKLICGAYIEARSCERFAALAPLLDRELADFYISLLRSEARHYSDYLTLAELAGGKNIGERVKEFGALEAELILSPDPEFKFHSGLPVSIADKKADESR